MVREEILVEMHLPVSEQMFSRLMLQEGQWVADQMDFTGLVSLWLKFWGEAWKWCTGGEVPQVEGWLTISKTTQTSMDHTSILFIQISNLGRALRQTVGGNLIMPSN